MTAAALTNGVPSVFAVVQAPAPPALDPVAIVEVDPPVERLRVRSN